MGREKERRHVRNVNGNREEMLVRKEAEEAQIRRTLQQKQPNALRNDDRHVVLRRRYHPMDPEIEALFFCFFCPSRYVDVDVVKKKMKIRRF